MTTSINSLSLLHTHIHSYTSYFRRFVFLKACFTLKTSLEGQKATAKLEPSPKIPVPY